MLESPTRRGGEGDRRELGLSSLFLQFYVMLTVWMTPGSGAVWSMVEQSNYYNNYPPDARSKSKGNGGPKGLNDSTVAYATIVLSTLGSARYAVGSTSQNPALTAGQSQFIRPS